MHSKNLVSIFIVCYNNGSLIYDAILSTLSQDYPAIELIVSDDGSDHGFNAADIKSFIDEHKRCNVKNVIVNVNTENYGTVRHLELLRELCNGEYEISIAADDMWNDNHVVSAFVDMFEQIGANAKWLVSQVAMYDDRMNIMHGVFVPQNVIRALKTRNLIKLSNFECHSCVLPGLGSAFRKDFFHEIGKLSEDYVLVEDYSTQLRALHKGIMPYYLDYITARHRSGGVSHGNVHNRREAYVKLLADYIHIFEKEILPYRNRFSFVCFCKGLLKYFVHVERYRKEAKSLIGDLNINAINQSITDDPQYVDKVMRCAGISSYLLWHGGLCIVKALIRLRLV